MRALRVVGLIADTGVVVHDPGADLKSWFSPGTWRCTRERRQRDPRQQVHRRSSVGSEQPERAGRCSWRRWSGVVIAAVRRDRETLALAGAACCGSRSRSGSRCTVGPAATRYLFEPAAVMVVIAGHAVGRVLASLRAGARPWPLRYASGGVDRAGRMVAGAVPTATRAGHRARRHRPRPLAGHQIDRLQGVIAKDGGAARIRACGQPVDPGRAPEQGRPGRSGMNVGNVGYRPGSDIDSGKPIVVLQAPRLSAGRCARSTSPRPTRPAATSCRDRPSIGDARLQRLQIRRQVAELGGRSPSSVPVGDQPPRVPRSSERPTVSAPATRPACR